MSTQVRIHDLDPIKKPATSIGNHHAAKATGTFAAFSPQSNRTSTKLFQEAIRNVAATPQHLNNTKLSQDLKSKVIDAKATSFNPMTSTSTYQTGKSKNSILMQH